MDEETLKDVDKIIHAIDNDYVMCKKCKHYYIRYIHIALLDLCPTCFEEVMNYDYPEDRHRNNK